MKLIKRNKRCLSKYDIRHDFSTYLKPLIVKLFIIKTPKSILHLFQENINKYLKKNRFIYKRIILRLRSKKYIYLNNTNI